MKTTIQEIATELAADAIGPETATWNEECSRALARRLGMLPSELRESDVADASRAYDATLRARVSGLRISVRTPAREPGRM